jgi:hypothetical protein
MRWDTTSSVLLAALVCLRSNTTEGEGYYTSLPFLLELEMPEVGGKKYKYTKEGIAAAKAASKKTGKKMSFGNMKPKQVAAIMAKYGKKSK